MSLSVYTIKHPLVINWTNYIINNQVTESDKFNIIHKIGISLIYEASRKSIQVLSLYLRKIDQMTEVNILAKNFTCSIITDLYLSQILSKDIINLVPFSSIYTIPYKDNDVNLSTFTLSDYLPDNLDSNQIIIVEEYLNTNKIMKTIDLIFEHYNIKQNIQICCIICKTSTLQVLGARYSNLNIYTTQIINDNNN